MTKPVSLPYAASRMAGQLMHALLRQRSFRLLEYITVSYALSISFFHMSVKPTSLFVKFKQKPFLIIPIEQDLPKHLCRCSDRSCLRRIPVHSVTYKELRKEGWMAILPTVHSKAMPSSSSLGWTQARSRCAWLICSSIRASLFTIWSASANTSSA